MTKLILIIALAAGLNASAASVTFADNFESANPSLNWTSATTFNDNGTGGHTTNYLLTTGSPNQWAQTTENLPTASSQYTATYLFNTTYNPSTQGAILFANFTMDTCMGFRKDWRTHGDGGTREGHGRPARRLAHLDQRHAVDVATVPTLTFRQIATGTRDIRPVIFQNGTCCEGTTFSPTTTWTAQDTGNVGSGTFTKPMSPCERPILRPPARSEGRPCHGFEQLRRHHQHADRWHR